MLNLINLPDKFKVLKISTSLYYEYISGGLLKHRSIRYKSSQLRQLWAFHFYPWPKQKIMTVDNFHYTFTVDIFLNLATDY